jgi:Secretion system C-terminal sorting domain
MKKLLLIIGLALTFNLNAQTDEIFNENCSTLSVGNIGSDLTGATPGQGGWTTFVSSTAVPAGQNSDFQVVDAGGDYGNTIRIHGTTAAASNNGRLLNKAVATEWAARTPGNDIANLEFDLYTGPVTTSKNTYRNYFFNTSGQAVAGFLFEPDTKLIKGWAYYDNTATAGGVVGYYVFALATGGVTLAADTWYKLGVSYDYNTGDITWKDTNGLFFTGVTSAATVDDLTSVDFRIVTSTANTPATSADVQIDNLHFYLSATDVLLSNNQVTNTGSKFNVYPNPAKSNIIVSNSVASISSIEMTDMNGRTVKTLNLSNVMSADVNVSDLSQGVYMMKIVSDKGIDTRKIIKE